MPRLIAQEEWFGEADLDIPFLRQVYRDYGWIDEFRREECFEYIHDFMDSLQESERGACW